MDTPIKQSFFNAMANEFDTHVRQSIPLYGDFVDNVRKNIVKHTAIDHSNRVLDICGSTGKLGADLIKEGYGGEYYNIDGSPQMIEICRQFSQESDRINPVLGGYMASWKDDGGMFIPEVDMGRVGYFDFTIEMLGFQFFTKKRGSQISNMRRLTSKNGACIICEKFDHRVLRVWREQEELKDTLWKSKFFTPEQIEAKKKTVLQDMGEYCYDYGEFKFLLESIFYTVELIYKAGNFAGFLCYDCDPDVFKGWEYDDKLIHNEFNAD